MPLNTSETRALRRGEYIIRQRRNTDTGEVYDVELKLSWDKLYYRLPGQTEWFRTPREARRGRHGH